jgi:hypothetical protein
VPVERRDHHPLDLYNALRVDEVCAADLADLGSDRGHRVLSIVGKVNRKPRSR